MKLFSWFDQKKCTSDKKNENSLNNNTMWPTASVDKNKPKIFYPKIAKHQVKPALNIRVKDA